MFLQLSDTGHAKIKGRTCEPTTEMSLCPLYLMKTAKEIEHSHLKVFGDSKLLMNWSNNRSIIENVLRAPIMKLVLGVEHSFDDISFIHMDTASCYINISVK